MLDLDTRTAILKLHEHGHGTRKISRAVGVSRGAVKRVIESGEAKVPAIERASEAEPYLELIQQLHEVCKGNLVRVHEELRAKGIEVGYSTLTSLCRKYGIGVKKKVASGHYEFAPGQESQHDTSPHVVCIGGKKRTVQCASLVLCFSRCVYAQVYPRFRRFHAKSFLTEAVCYFGGTTKQIMVDNTHVLVSHGTGANAVFCAEFEAWSGRFSTKFVAHEKGDANRSAHVERNFHYIENNFYKGRQFESLRDLNAQLHLWCDKVNASFKPKLRFIPNEMRVIEQPTLNPLPLHIPEVYALHERMVDIEGYVALHSNRYSVPEQLIHRTVQVHETKELIRIFLGHELIAQHDLVDQKLYKKLTLPEHRRKKRSKKQTPTMTEQESVLCEADPVLAQMVQVLQKTSARPNLATRRLYRLWRDYPKEPVLDAVKEALHYGQKDMQRVESMILQRVRGDFFRLHVQQGGEES